MPFSDPLADGPVIQAAGNARAGGRARTTPGVLEVGRGLAERVPVIVMTYANLVLARGAERFADELRRRRRRRADRARPAAARRATDVLRGVRRGRASRSCRSWRPTTPDERLARIGAARPRLRLHGVGHRHDRRARRDGRRPRGHAGAPSRPTTDVPVALGFGIATRRAGRARGRGRRRGRHRRHAAWCGPPPRPTIRAAAGRPDRGRARRGASVDSRAMGLVLTTTFGLVVWIVLWALGAKAIDAFLITRRGRARRRHGADADAVSARQSPAPERPGTSDATSENSRRLNAIRRPRHCVASEPTGMLLASYRYRVLEEGPCEHVHWQPRAAL